MGQLDYSPFGSLLPALRTGLGALWPMLGVGSLGGCSQITCAVKGNYDLGGRWQRQSLIFQLGVYNRNARQLGCPSHKLFFLIVGRACGINHNIFSISRGFAEEIKNGDSVVAVRFAERVSVHVDFGYFGNACQSCKLGRIGQPVISDIYSL
jgi:hypothetical protein